MNKYSNYSKSKQPQDEIFIPEAVLDYHEIEITHHYQIKEELDLFLKKASKDKKKKVRVITGKGMVVRPEVLKLLKNHPLVESFKQSDYYSGQWGAVDIKLKT